MSKNIWNFDEEQGHIDIDVSPSSLKEQNIGYMLFLKSELARLKEAKFDLDLSYMINDLRGHCKEDGFQFEIYARAGAESQSIYDEAGYKTVKEADKRAKAYIKEFKSFWKKYIINN